MSRGRRAPRPGPTPTDRRPGRARRTSTTPSAATTTPTATSGIDERHRRRQREQHDRGQDDLHDLPGGALPGDGPQRAPDIAHVAAVADPAVDVADDRRRAA